MENGFRQVWVKRKTLQSGNDAVPSKRRAVPGRARIRERSFRGFGRHHVQVRHRSAEPAIELLTRSPYFGDFSFEIVDRPFLRVERMIVRRERVDADAALERGGHQDGQLSARRQGELENRLSGVDLIPPRRKS